jgi:iron complex outermembrane receptor protein
MGNLYRRLMVSICAALLAGGTLTFTDADAQSTLYDLNIPSEDLATALQSFAIASHHKLLYKAELTAGKTSRALNGHFTAEQAIEALLSGTGLKFRITGSSVVLISDQNDGKAGALRLEGAASATIDDVPNGASSSREEKRGTSGAFRMAQVDRENNSGATSPGVQSKGAQSIFDGSSSKSQGGGNFDEIVVTAQRHQQNLRDVPISITVLGGTRLDAATDIGVTEALTHVPGVSVIEGYQTGGTMIGIRGVAVPNIQGNGASPIGYYIDSVPFGFIKTAISPDLNAYDLERVEVLRGPQGTLYGASALNGVVRVLTHQADLDDFDFKTRASTSNTDSGAENYRTDTAVNIPIIPGKLAVRAVVGYENLSGWVDKPNDNNANNGHELNLRLRVNAQPTPELSVGATTWSSRGSFGSANSGNDDKTSRSTIAEPIKPDFDLFGANVAYDFSGFSIASSTSYLGYSLDSLTDANPPVPGSSVLTLDLRNRVFSEEVSLNSKGSGPWRWSLGGIYRDEKDRSYQIRRNELAGNVPTGGYVQPAAAENTSNSWAAFGELTRILGPVELTAGLRYFHDSVGVQELLRQTGDPSTKPPGTILASPLINQTEDFHKLSPRGVLTWHATDDVMAYASYSEGFRSGADQTPSVIINSPVPYPSTKPDTLKNYEVGTKGSFLGGKLLLDASAYYIDWKDVQTVLVVKFGQALLPAIVNGSSASGVGVDLGVTAKPIDGVTLDLGFSTNTLSADTDIFASPGVLLYHRGDRLYNSPKYSGNISADYAFPLGIGNLQGDLSANTRYTSENDFNAVSGRTLLIGRGDSIWIAGAKFSVQSPKGWTGTLFVDNLTNNYGAIARNPFVDPPFFYTEWTNHPRPRTIGVQLEYKYR